MYISKADHGLADMIQPQCKGTWKPTEKLLPGPSWSQCSSYQSCWLSPNTKLECTLSFLGTTRKALGGGGGGGGEVAGLQHRFFGHVLASSLPTSRSDLCPALNLQVCPINSSLPEISGTSQDTNHSQLFSGNLHTPGERPR